MSMPINFTLPALDTSFNMDLSGALSTLAPSAITAAQTGVFYVLTSTMKDVFKFQTDSLDVNDLDATDLKYYVFKTNWPANLYINPAHAMMNKTESVSEFAGIAAFDASKNLLKHDFLRYLAFKLFNTAFGVDLFSNETALLENLATKGHNVHMDISAALAAVSSTATLSVSGVSPATDASSNKYFGNDLSNNSNLCRQLLRQIAHSDPARFATILDSSNSNFVQSVPFIDGDSINFTLVCNAAPGQNALTGVAAIPARTYNIKLVMKPNITGANANTRVGDSASWSMEWPYSS